MDKVFLTIPQIVNLTSICRSRIYMEIRAGRLKIIKIGASTRIRWDDFQAWQESLSSSQEVSHAH